jgi:glycosyltransferase involved in cell wall biosynthesis
MIGAGKVYAGIERFSAAFLTDGLISVSEDLAEFLRLSRISLKHLRVIRNGIDLSAAISAPALNSEPQASGGVTIGTVGRLVGVKNQRCLLMAFRIILDQIGTARLIIVGDGPLGDELKLMASELGISDHVLFAGFQRNVSACIRGLDVFVLSSLHEGVPISLLEAMSMGIPVVCTRVGGIPEVITHNHNGLLVEPDDANSLAAAVMRISADSAFARMLAKNARSTLLNELSLESCLAGTISLYRETVLK